MLSAVALSLLLGVATGCGANDAPETDTAPPAARGQTPSGQVGGTPQASTPTAGEQVTSAYTGPYDESFQAELPAYSGQQVSLTGEVRDLVRSRSSYEIGDPTDPSLDPLLISARYAVPDVEEGTRVEVTGILREGFDPPVVEEAGEDDGEVGFYDQHRGEPYLDEARVKVLGATGQ